MPTNPYLSDDTDDDVFESDDGFTADHTFGNRKCRKRGCGLTHDVRLKDGVDLPPEVAAELSKLLDSIPPEIAQKAVVVGEVVEQAALRDVFLRFAHVVRRLNPTAPINLAVAQVLDDQTNGAVSKRFYVYKAEWYVVNVHLIMKILKKFIDWMSNERDPTPPQTLLDQLEETRTYIQSRLDHYIEEYRTACELYDHPIDDNVIAEGIPHESRILAREIMFTNLEDSLSTFFEGRGMRDPTTED